MGGNLSSDESNREGGPSERRPVARGNSPARQMDQSPGSMDDSDSGSDSGSDNEASPLNFGLQIFEINSPSDLLAAFRRHPARGSMYHESDRNIPSPTPMDRHCDLYQQMLTDCGQSSLVQRPVNVCQQIEKRQLQRDTPSQSARVASTVHMLPEHHCLIDVYSSRVFCGTYSQDGSLFVSSTQDSCIRLYDTRGSRFKCFKVIHGRDIGWSILDTVMSPDQAWLAYSTWSPYINVVSIHDDKHFSLDLLPDVNQSFCIFSIKFSSDGNELFASCNDEHIYVYDRTRCERVLCIPAHSDDVSALNIEGESPHMIYTGGDDGLCKVWDRRILSESSPSPVGVLAGHKDGITYIDSKGDCRYIITNSKDQTIKLWDMRKFSPQETVEATLSRVSRQTWDYRWEEVPMRAQRESQTRLPGDTSVMTYAGHLVKHTLLRCRFSPSATTGQRYIYAACAKGRVIIYDVLTGEIVKKLQTKTNISNAIRDVSWHPTNPGELVSSSWDGLLEMWTTDERRPYYRERPYH